MRAKCGKEAVKPGEIPIHARREARKQANLNAFCWGVGNGLLSTTLIVYLIRDLCEGWSGAAIGTAIAWIVAAPRLLGTLRLTAPFLIARSGNRKLFCIVAYLLAPPILATIPLVMPSLISVAHETGRINPVLGFLIAVWCLHHVCEYFGTIALWSWYGDLIGMRIRGRFVGRREASLIAGQTLGYLAAGLYTYFTVEALPADAPRWKAYLLPCGCGVLFSTLAVVPLCFIPDIMLRKADGRGNPESPCIAAGGVYDALYRFIRLPRDVPGFAALFVFGCWLQAAIGLTQAAQYRFGMTVLGVSMLFALAQAETTRVGQWALGGRVGRWIDRFGAGPVVGFSLFLAASGSLFYAIADEESWYLIFGAAIAWIFWVGVNVGITGTLLNIAPADRRAECFALYFAATTLTLALTTLLGGYADDRLRAVAVELPVYGAISYERLSFLLSWAMRVAAIPLFLWAIRRC